jgi:hypothetical protein
MDKKVENKTAENKPKDLAKKENTEKKDEKKDQKKD